MKSEFAVWVSLLVKKNGLAKAGFRVGWLINSELHLQSYTNAGY